MMSIIRSELMKFLTLPNVWIVTGVPFVLFLFLQFTVLGDNTQMVADVRPDGMVEYMGVLSHAGTEIMQNLGVSIFNPGILLPILGAVIAGVEFRAGQLGLSLVAVPNRNRLILGKILATTLYVVGFSLLCIAVATVFTYIAIKDWNSGLLWSSDMLVAHGRLLLFMVTSTLIGLAITLITRRTLTGIITSVVLMMLTLSQVVAMISPTVDALLPLSAARNLLLQGRSAGAPLTGSAEHGAIVLISWAVITIIFAAVALKRRDAQ